MLTPVPSPRFDQRPLLFLLLIALAGRILLLLSGSVSFHSDEAIIGLMARHILAGNPPTFFYGQAYMGSLDAWLVAAGFRIFGESVLTIRLVQSALYLGVVASAWWAAWALSRSRQIAFITGLLFAVPPVLLALYSTATLGGYNETLIFGNLIVGLGCTLAHEQAEQRWRWLLLGFIAGLGWWTNALIMVYALPVAAYLLWRMWQLRERRAFLWIGLALAMFCVGSLPWWAYALQNDLAPIRFFLPDVLGGRETVGAVIPSVPFSQRILGLLLFGLPSVIGLRFPWSGDYFLPLACIGIALLFAVALFRLARGQSRLQMGAVPILFGILLTLCAVFLLTRFSSDPSGRYFLPLLLPLAIVFAAWVTSLRRGLKALLIGAVIAYFALGQFYAATTASGFTTQFVAQTHLPNDDDQALIAWLDAQDIRHGYTTYWISFRLAFLSGESLQLSAALPDKSDLVYTPAFERYAPYQSATDAAARIAYITANVPELDAALQAWFADVGVTYCEAVVGIYRVYYDFAPALPRPPLP
jgi:4-amino-4-deoxy-L-arabinose transferase-like glycosyltransferase